MGAERLVLTFWSPLDPLFTFFQVSPTNEIIRSISATPANISQQGKMRCVRVDSSWRFNNGASFVIDGNLTETQFARNKSALRVRAQIWLIAAQINHSRRRSAATTCSFRRQCATHKKASGIKKAAVGEMHLLNVFGTDRRPLRVYAEMRWMEYHLYIVSPCNYVITEECAAAGRRCLQ